MKKKLMFLLFTVAAAALGGAVFAGCGEGNIGDGNTHEHVYGQYMSNGDASCERDGTKTAYCTICYAPNTIIDEGTKLAHTFETYYYNNDATCISGGTKTAYCTYCLTATDTIEDETHPKLDHVFTDYISDNNATCDENGTQTALCDSCHTAKDVKEEAGTAGHTYVGGSCSVCHVSHLKFVDGGESYVVAGIADDCEDTEIIIPATENGLPVRSILDNAFKDNTALTKITIPESVTLIGNNAFDGCANLTSVEGGSGIKDLRYAPFANCVSLEEISFSDSLETVGQEAFADCISLKTVTFGKNVNSLSPDAFDGCVMLSAVNIGEGSVYYKSQGGIVYDGMYRIVYVPYAIEGRVDISNQTTSIESTCFQNRKLITAVSFGTMMCNIKDYSFNGCDALTDIYYAGTVEEWTVIDKKNHWKEGSGNFTVHCSDVDLSKEEC